QSNFNRALIELDITLKDKACPANLRAASLAWKGYCHHSSGNVAAAIDDYRQALSLNRNLNYVSTQLAISLLQLKRYDEFKSEWRELLKAEPENHSYYFKRGLAYFANGNFNESAQDLSNFLKLERFASENCPGATVLLSLSHHLNHSNRAAHDALVSYEKNAT